MSTIMADICRQVQMDYIWSFVLFVCSLLCLLFLLFSPLLSGYSPVTNCVNMGANSELENRMVHLNPIS